MEASIANVAQQQVRSVARAVDVVRVLARAGRPVGIAELARLTGSSSAGVHGLVRTLELQGLIERDAGSGRCRLGPELLVIGAGYLRTSRLHAASLNAARGLAAVSGESVRVALLHRGSVMIVHHVVGGDAIQAPLDVGALEPVGATALGRALLASGRAGGQGHSGACAPDESIEAEIRAVATRGWASVIHEPASGLASLAAPVTSSSLAKPGAIGIQGPIERVCELGAPRLSLITGLLESARAICRQLDATAP